MAQTTYPLGPSAAPWEGESVEGSRCGKREAPRYFPDISPPRRRVASALLCLGLVLANVSVFLSPSPSLRTRAHAPCSLGTRHYSTAVFLWQQLSIYSFSGWLVLSIYHLVFFPFVCFEHCGSVAGFALFCAEISNFAKQKWNNKQPRLT